MALTADEQQLVDSVRTLARGAFTRRATQNDRTGTLSPRNIDDLRNFRVPAMGLPEQFGGLGVSAECQTRVVEEVAYGDGSTAVALNMHLLIADFFAFLPPWPRRTAILEDIGRNGALVCGPGSVPTGQLDTRQAGYRFTDGGETITANGKAGFASMSDAAKYVFLAGTLDRGEDQEPDVVVTMAETGTPGLTVLGNWDAMGLRSTASHDITCEDVTLPKSDALIIPSAILRAIRTQGAGVTQDRARGALGILAIWLGLAQAAFDFTVDYVKHRYGYLAGPAEALGAVPSMRSEQPWAQTAIGQMEHWLETGRIILYDTVARLDTTFASPAAFTQHLVRTVYHLRRMAEEVAMGAMKVCGAHAYVKARPLERIFRDLMGGVVMAWKTDELVMTLGQGSLGMPITIVGPAGA